MKKTKKSLMRGVVILGVALILVLSFVGCLDPISMMPDFPRLQGDFNMTDVTAGAFVINNLSRTLVVDQIDVRHWSYRDLTEERIINSGMAGTIVVVDGAANFRRFGNRIDSSISPVIEPQNQRAIFANASEHNYSFELFWTHPSAQGISPLKRSLAIPASRMVREFYLFIDRNGNVRLTENPVDVMNESDIDDTIPIEININPGGGTSVTINSELKIDQSLIQHFNRTQEILVDLTNGVNIMGTEIRNGFALLNTTISRGFNFGTLVIENLSDQPITTIEIFNQRYSYSPLPLDEEFGYVSIRRFESILTEIPKFEGGNNTPSRGELILPVGTYDIVVNNSAVIRQVVVVADSASGSANANLHKFENLPEPPLPGTPRFTGISFSVLSAGVRLTTVGYGDTQVNLNANSVWLPSVIFHAPGETPAQRQVYVNQSNAAWNDGEGGNIVTGPGITSSGAPWGLTPYYAVIDGSPLEDRWLRYRIHPSVNNGENLSLTIYFR